MNWRTLRYQQTQSKRWNFYKTPELKAFYPQETFGEDLTNFSIPLDPTWNDGLYEDTIPPADRDIDPLFGSPINGRMLHGRWDFVKDNIERWGMKVEIAKQDLANLELTCRLELKWAKKAGWNAQAKYLKKSHKKQIQKYKEAVKRAERHLADWLLEAKKYDY